MKNLFEYNPVIYPRLLWVSNNIKDLNRVFTFCSIDDLVTEEPNSYLTLMDDFNSGEIGGLTIPVMRKEDNRLGVLVIIPDDVEDITSTIPHEALHVTDYILDSLDIPCGPFKNNENQAYVLGWAASSISNAVIKLRK